MRAFSRPWRRERAGTCFMHAAACPWRVQVGRVGSSSMDEWFFTVLEREAEDRL